MTIHIDYPKDEAPLYYRRHGECNPAGHGRLVLDPEADEPRLYMESGRYVGDGTPCHEWHGRLLVWLVSSYLTEAQCRELLDAVAPLAERVAEGYECSWDGHNHVGRIDEDATSAYDEIQSLCELVEGEAQVWDVAEWLSPTSTKELRALGSTPEIIAEALDREAAHDGIVLDGDLVGYVRERIDTNEEETAPKMDDYSKPVELMRAYAALTKGGK